MKQKGYMLGEIIGLNVPRTVESLRGSTETVGKASLH